MASNAGVVVIWIAIAAKRGLPDNEGHLPVRSPVAALLFLAFFAIYLLLWSFMFGSVEPRYNAAHAATQLDPLEAKLKRVAVALDETRKHLEFVGSAVPELEAELRLKTAAIRSLQNETDSLGRLAAMKRIDTAPIQELITQTVRSGQAQAAKSSGRRERAYLLIGLGLSLPLGMLVNVIYDAVKERI